MRNEYQRWLHQFCFASYSTATTSNACHFENVCRGKWMVNAKIDFDWLINHCGKIYGDRGEATTTPLPYSSTGVL